MMGHTHSLIGSALGLGVALSTHADSRHTLLLLGIGAVVALLPDIDHPQAPIRRKLGCLGNVLFGRLKHRGITHTLIAILAVGAAAYVALPPFIGELVIMAYYSHILADMLTVSGLPVFWPYKKESYHLLPKRLCMTTNTLPERLIAFVLVLLILSKIPVMIPQF
jgi:inner membrane protein